MWREYRNIVDSNYGDDLYQELSRQQTNGNEILLFLSVLSNLVNSLVQEFKSTSKVIDKDVHSVLNLITMAHRKDHRLKKELKQYVDQSKVIYIHNSSDGQI